MPQWLDQFHGLPRTVYLLCVGTWINRAGSFIVPFLTLYITDELGYDIAFASLAIATFGFGSIAANLIGGVLTDRLGRKPTIVLSMFGTGGLLVLFGNLESRPAVLIGILLFAAISELYRPAVSSMIADLLPDDRRTAAFGLMYLAINVGFTTAALAGGWLAARSFSWLFWGDAVTCAGFGIVMLFAIDETRPSGIQDAASESESQASSGGLGAVRASSDDRPGFDHRSNENAAVFAGVCVAATLVAIVFSQAFSNMPIDLSNRGFGIEIYGRILAVNGLMITLLQMPMTALVDRWHRGTAMIGAALLTGLGFGLIGWAGSPWLLALTVMVFTVGEIAQGPILPAIVSDLAPVAARGRYMGILNMLFPLSLVIGGPLGAFVLAGYGSRSLWSGAFVLGLVAALLYRTLYDRLDRRRLNRP